MRVLTFTLAVFLIAVAGGVVVLVSVLGDEREPVVEVRGGNAQAGAGLIERYGCTSCHLIPGITAPEGRVGPPLDDFSERRYIAGDEPNRPEVLIRWVQNPQAIEPGTLMPNLGVSEAEARDIAAYLYSLP
jgi:cytochrome c